MPCFINSINQNLFARQQKNTCKTPRNHRCGESLCLPNRGSAGVSFTVSFDPNADSNDMGICGLGGVKEKFCRVSFLRAYNEGKDFENGTDG